jgi:hypothetical protein
MAFQPKGTGAIDLAAGSSGVNISNGGTVTAITRTAAAVTGYTSIPSCVISAPTTAGGVQATVSLTMAAQSGTVVTPANGGTGYTLNDVLTVVGGTFVQAAQFTVTGVSGGVVTQVTRSNTNYGQYTVLPSSPATTTGGTGTGCTLNMLYEFLTASISNAGSGYIEQPTITFSGGGGSGAAAYATVGSTSIVRGLGQTTSFYTPSGEAFRTVDIGNTTVNAMRVSGGTVNNAPSFYAIGSDTNIDFACNTKGTGAFRFYTNQAQEQLRVSHTASAVNYVQVTGNVTGQRPTLSAQGSDANIGFAYNSKGSSGHIFSANLGSGATLFNISGSSSTANYLQVSPASASGTPVLSTQGSDTNIDLALTPKGTGVVRAQGTALSAENGIILNKQTVAANVSVSSGYSAHSAGPVTVSSGVSVTIASGSRWVVI